MSWSNFSVSKSLPTPLYHQIFSHLRDCIQTGIFAPGSVFPSENQIEQALKVSRITARRAMDELSARGLIERHQGKPSRVAAYRPSTRLLAGVEGMIENNRRMGDSTTVELLTHETVSAGERIARKLKIKVGEKVLWSVRVRSLDGTPFSYAVTYLPPAITRQIKTEQMSSKPLLELLENAGVVIGRAEQIISAQQATTEVARALHVEVNSALLVSERIVYDQSERPVEWIEVQYRPDIYQYRVDLERTQSSEGNVWATAQPKESLPTKKSSLSRRKNRSST
ncbi:GntR family transcriptional regulator [Zwartia vadi]|uniref:GntR family transcriptional regulator n=1 Tax=Zwartia vadi TaxID=3058168 RepID=UPI0025B2F802|nr:GntR family transcriptional regulator [Zwartia vadi]MDN3986755.1 GntR family transcriptional regulator [Zwartia vadi]